MYFSFENLEFLYDPYPIGLAKPLMAEATYQELSANFPALELFLAHKDLGKAHQKYTLSEKQNAETYYSFIKSSPLWRDFHAWVRSDEFIYGFLEALKRHYLDFGLSYVPPKQRTLRRLRDIVRGRLCDRSPHLHARFEFSALPADGGKIIPHTDARQKIATLVVSMAQEGEWDPAFGGGTDMNRPKEVRHSYNFVNRQADFEDMEIVHTFEYQPNQAVIFIKTHNSWHSVRPMTGAGSGALRKTLTINIVRDR